MSQTTTTDYVFDLMGVVIGFGWREEVITALQGNQELRLRIQKLSPHTPLTTISEGLEHIALQKQDDPTFNKHDQKHTRLRELLLITAVYQLQEGTLVIPLEEDVEQTLRALKEAGKNVHLYTSASLPFTRAVTAPISPHFTTIFSSTKDPTIKNKYSPQSYKAIAKALGKRTAQLGYVSDDQKEAIAAAQAGCSRVYHLCRKAFKPSKQQGYKTITTLREMV